MASNTAEGKDSMALAAVRRSNSDWVVGLAEMSAVTVKVPTLGIAGTADPYRKDFERLEAAMPQIQIVLIEGASHAAAPERPEYIRAVKGFLGAHPARTYN